MKHSRLLCTAASIFLVTAPASARFFLTDTDYAYLATQNIERTNSIFQNLSPNEEATLHDLINDRQTESEPSARAKIVTDTLIGFVGRRRWEQMHPGKLWGDRRSGDQELPR